jgi:hypothetical protein
VKNTSSHTVAAVDRNAEGAKREHRGNKIYYRDAETTEFGNWIRQADGSFLKFFRDIPRCALSLCALQIYLTQVPVNRVDYLEDIRRFFWFFASGKPRK